MTRFRSKKNPLPSDVSKGYSQSRMVYQPNKARPNPFNPAVAQIETLLPTARRSNLRDNPELDRAGRVWVPRRVVGMSRRRVVKALKRLKVQVTV